MALDQAAVVRKVRSLASTVPGIGAAYSAADSDDNRLPPGLSALTTSALVLPGNTIRYILQPGQHEHTYEVVVQVLTAGGDPGVAAAEVAPMPDRVLEVMLQHVKLDDLVTVFKFERSQGLRGFEYGGIEFTGYELVFLVTEHAAATPAGGTA